MNERMIYDRSYTRQIDEYGNLIDSITNEKIGICMERETELILELNQLKEKEIEYYDLLVKHGIIEKPVTVDDLKTQMFEMQKTNEEERRLDRKQNAELQDMLAKLLGGMQNGYQGTVPTDGDIPTDSKPSRTKTKTDGNKSE